MSNLETILLAAMVVSSSITVYMAFRQASAKRFKYDEEVDAFENRMKDLLTVMQERHEAMLKVIAKAERTMALQRALKLTGQENQAEKFRDAERMLSGGIPIREVAERLALPKAELELLLKVRKSKSPKMKAELGVG